MLWILCLLGTLQEEKHGEENFGQRGVGFIICRLKAQNLLGKRVVL